MLVIEELAWQNRLNTIQQYGEGQSGERRETALDHAMKLSINTKETTRQKSRNAIKSMNPIEKDVVLLHLHHPFQTHSKCKCCKFDV